MEGTNAAAEGTQGEGTNTAQEGQAQESQSLMNEAISQLEAEGKEKSKAMGEAEPEDVIPDENEEAKEETKKEAKEDTEEKEEETKEDQEETKEEKVEKEIHKLFQKIQNIYKEDKFEEDNQYLDKAYEHLEGLEKYKSDNDEANQKLVKVLQSHPDLTNVIKDLIGGNPLRVSLAKYFKPEDFNPVEGDDQKEALEKSHKERADRIAEQERIKSELTKNEQESLEVLKKFITDKKLSEEVQKAYLPLLNQHISDLQNLKLTPEFLEFHLGGHTRTTDIENAIKQAEIKAKNEKIIQEKDKKENDSDGMPTLTPDNKTEKEKGKKLNQSDQIIFDTIDKGFHRK